MAKDAVTYTHDGMELPVDDWKQGEHSFVELAQVIQSTHDAAQSSAVKAINRMQTMRNWLIGYYIVEFEQHGKDRAEYGSRLLKKLEEKVARKGLNVTLFKNARNFYLLYPQMVDNFVFINVPLSDSSSAPKGATVSDFFSIRNDKEKSPTVLDQLKTPGNLIIARLSFSHIVEIMTVDDPLARYFYEQECIKCTWSVRELRRQISTNLYVRAGISKNPEKMLSLPSMKGHDSNELQIREPFTSPIGILLCTRKGKKMVEYALAGMDNQLFVSTYMLQLPDKKTLEDFLLKQLEENKF